MAHYFIAIIGAILVTALLYFGPGFIPKKNKLLLAGTAIVLSFIGLVAAGYLPFWLTAGLMAGLSFIAAYITEKKLGAIPADQAGWEAIPLTAEPAGLRQNDSLLEPESRRIQVVHHVDTAEQQSLLPEESEVEQELEVFQDLPNQLENVEIPELEEIAVPVEPETILEEAENTDEFDFLVKGRETEPVMEEEAQPEEHSAEISHGREQLLGELEELGELSEVQVSEFEDQASAEEKTIDIAQSEDLEDLIQLDVLTEQDSEDSEENEAEAVLPDVMEEKKADLSPDILEFMIEQVSWVREHGERAEFESVLTTVLQQQLSPKDYYIFSGLLRDFYIQEKENLKLASLLSDLKERYLEYGVIKNEIEYYFTTYLIPEDIVQ
ncbi:hypothetical protein LCY76_15210 [Fictibacillus sp. KIGAM418]|uniref:Uncharacterized protein n=1 Tax=Fictibacillus marinisediminis TaxID=2878389 RepID=A0A9X1XCB1_9BACL|nr:hypothetical protein [Fictibacillus marinisediminis]MCK6257928.1 hypothetical protein [Fictibacillus marinisediminis]